MKKRVRECVCMCEREKSRSVFTLGRLGCVRSDEE